MKIKTKSKKVNKAWLHDHMTDPYVKMAQKDGYRSRAAYKLSEIDEQFKLIHPGQLVVDLGSAPGAWSQYLRRKFAPKAAGRRGGLGHGAEPLRGAGHRFRPDRPPGRAGDRIFNEPPEAGRRSGDQSLPRQRLQSARRAVQ